ncbi:MAG: flagellar biosynthesis protein FliQ [Alphaproteobacteria bacterium]|nr:flagellar biosynthesis protein FliQ [Alphaproteobacteria bacterium]
MGGGEVLDLARESMWVLILMTAPVMIVGLVVGLGVGLLQALTQIQEATLVFVPKILSIFIAIIILLPFMAATMSGLMTTIVQMIINP